MNRLALLLAVGWPPLSVQAGGRFAVMTAAPTLSPRYYQAAFPAGDTLGKRQAECESGRHPCLDIGSLGEGFCCDDDTYCITDPSNAGKAACCAIGSVCGSPCSEDQYQCNQTVTLPASAPTAPPTTTVRPACCPRACTRTSMFLCPSSMGGGCCSYGQVCASDNHCLAGAATTPPSPSSSHNSAPPPGCTTGQIACPASAGGGCCADTQRCTFADGSAQCAQPTVPTASGVSTVPRKGSAGAGGFGEGAKAGVAVGVLAVGGSVVGGVAWLFLRRRRRRRGESNSGGGGNGGGGDGGGRVSGAGVRGGTGGGSRFRSRSGMALSGGGSLGGSTRLANGGPYGAGEMSESHSDVVSHGGRLRGLTQDYFGPDAVAGPFTEAGRPGTPAGVRGRECAVPTEPHGPDDITGAVEIDSRMREATAEESAATPASASIPLSRPRETPDGRVELYGSEVPSVAAVSPSTSPFGIEFEEILGKS